MSLLVIITVPPCSSVADKKHGLRKEVPFRITTTQTPDQSPSELDDSILPFLVGELHLRSSIEQIGLESYIPGSVCSFVYPSCFDF